MKLFQLRSTVDYLRMTGRQAATIVGVTAWTAIAALAAEPATYSTVRPIIEKRCQSCHQKGEIGPMAFTSYQDTRPWAKAIRNAVLRRTMPPWHADPVVSKHFTNDRSLPENEIRALVAWVDSGSPEGAPTLPPPGSLRAPDREMGRPDLVIRVPGFPVKASGTVQYTFLITPTDFPEDKWIAAAEWKIDQRQVVHHMNAFIRPKGSSYLRDAPANEFYVASKDQRIARRPDELEADRRELLIGYEPGYRLIPWGQGRAKLLAKGSDIVFEIHYNPNGKAVTDYSELALYFAQEPPKERVLSIMPADTKFAIPPGAASHESRAGATITSDVKLISVQPHMHLRGKDYLITAQYPGGQSETLIRVPRYDFNWQTTYFLAEPLLLPAGTVLHCVAHFDNSPNNPFNPDPSKIVMWGDQSWEEMNIGFMEIAFDARANPNVVVMHDSPKPAPSASERAP